MQQLAEQIFTHKWLRSTADLVRLKRLFLSSYLHYLSFAVGADEHDRGIQQFIDTRLLPKHIGLGIINTLIAKSIRSDGISEYSVLPLGRLDDHFDSIPGLTCLHKDPQAQRWSRLAAILVKDNRSGEILLVSIGDLLPFEFHPAAADQAVAASNIQTRLFSAVKAYFQKKPREHETLFTEFYAELQDTETTYLDEVLEATQQLASNTQRPTRPTRIQRPATMKVTLHTMILHVGDQLVMAKTNRASDSRGHIFRCEAELFRKQSFNKRRHSFQDATADTLTLDAEKLAELMPSFLTLEACAPSQVVMTQRGHGHELAPLVQFWNGEQNGRSPFYNLATQVTVTGHRLYKIVFKKLLAKQPVPSTLLTDHCGARLQDPVIMPDTHSYSRANIVIDSNTFRRPSDNKRITHIFWCCPRNGEVYLDAKITDDLFTRQLLDMAFPDPKPRAIVSLNY